MKVVALYSIKGGVGKTAAAVNLAHAAACDGLRTLLLDLDPQGATSFYFRVRPRKKAGVKALLAGGERVRRAIRATDYDDLDILPAHASFRRLERVLDQVKKSRSRLARLVDGQKRDYDLVVVDCPPTLTLVAENVFRAADLVLVPVVPTTLSQRTLDMLLEFFAAEKLKTRRLRAFFSLVDRRKSLHRELMARLPETGDARFLQSVIPASSDIERMGLSREPVACYAPLGKGAVAVQELWQEVRPLLF